MRRSITGDRAVHSSIGISNRSKDPPLGVPFAEKGVLGRGFGPGRRTQRRPWPANGWPTNGPGKAGGDRGSVRLGCWCRPQCRISYPISRRAFASRTTDSWKYRVLRGSEIPVVTSRHHGTGCPCSWLARRSRPSCGASVRTCAPRRDLSRLAYLLPWCDRRFLEVSAAAPNVVNCVCGCGSSI